MSAEVQASTRITAIFGPVARAGEFEGRHKVLHVTLLA